MNRNLKLRVLTALAGVPVVLFLLLGWGIEGTALLSWVISMGMLYEFCRMTFTLPDALRKTVAALLVNAVIHGLNYALPGGISFEFLTAGPLLLFFGWFLFLVPGLLGYQGREFADSAEGVRLLKVHVHELMALTFAMIYCAAFPLLMVNIREMSRGGHWLVFTLIVIWASDSFAYFAGLRFGKKRLFEVVSPKKSWEGVYGGALGAVLTGSLYAAVFLPRSSLLWTALVALVLTGAGIIGDLAESLLKRAASVKDSGSILPGHGGFLDRFDSFVFALPVMYGILRIFG